MKKYNITVNGTTYEVIVEEADGSVSTPAYNTPVNSQPAPATPKAAPAQKTSVGSGSEGAVKVSSPMPGTILAVKVSVGQEVKKGDVICVLEAMKMENDIPAPQDGVIASVNVQKGASVNAGDILASLN